MARYTESVCRLCRREGVKLFLKGDRCYSGKCAIDKRPTPPGQHGVSRKKVSDYGLHLREKQKLRRAYGLLEKQFAHTFAKAAKVRNMPTGDALLMLLELRLDSVCYRLGFGNSRPQARQMVTHGHITVNGKRVDVASYQVKVGDVIEITFGQRKLKVEVLQVSETASKSDAPAMYKEIVC